MRTSKMENNNRRGVYMFTEPSGKAPSLARIQREESHMCYPPKTHTRSN